MNRRVVSTRRLWPPIVMGLTLATTALLLHSVGLSSEQSKARTDPTKKALESGRAVGEVVPSFFVRAVTGPLSNKSVCYVCRNGDRPVVMVVMKGLNPQLKQFLKETDEIVDKNRGVGLRCFAVLLDDQPAKAAPQLQTLAFDEKIALPLTVATTTVAAPSCQNIHRDAQVTIVLYRRQKVVDRFGFRSGEFTSKRVLTLLERVRGFAKPPQ